MKTKRILNMDDKRIEGFRDYINGLLILCRHSDGATEAKAEATKGAVAVLEEVVRAYDKEFGFI